MDDADREYFRLCLQKWQKRLGLTHWRIVLSPKLTKMCAEVHYDHDLSTRLARVLVGKDFGGEAVTKETLESTALHELLHILLKEYKDVCTNSPLDEENQMLREHEIIHKLETLLMDLESDRNHQTTALLG